LENLGILRGEDNHQTIDGIQKTGRVGYLRFDKVRIKREESEGMVGIDVDVGIDVVDIDWDKAGLDSSGVNLLLLSDRLRDCHLRLRKHLYLDRNRG
jgi:hypothetical protein